MSHLLQRLAEWIYPTDHVERVVIRDEYEIVRCSLEVSGDDFHGVARILSQQLPVGWEMNVDGKEW